MSMQTVKGLGMSKKKPFMYMHAPANERNKRRKSFLTWIKGKLFRVSQKLRYE